MIFGVSKLSVGGEERPQLWVALKERQCSEMLLVERRQRANGKFPGIKDEQFGSGQRYCEVGGGIEEKM